MISDFTAQYFGGNENCVNAKFKLLLNHSNLIIMLQTMVFIIHKAQVKITGVSDWLI